MNYNNNQRRDTVPAWVRPTHGAQYQHAVREQGPSQYGQGYQQYGGQAPAFGPTYPPTRTADPPYLGPPAAPFQSAQRPPEGWKWQREEARANVAEARAAQVERQLEDIKNKAEQEARMRDMEIKMEQRFQKQLYGCCARERKSSCRRSAES